MIVDVKNYETMQGALEALCSFLRAHGVSSDCIFDSKLVACELLGNVLRHADGQAKLQGEIKDGFLELKILTAKVFPIIEKSVCVDVLSEHGRGLFLVQEVCEHRVFTEDDGVRVYIRIK